MMPGTENCGPEDYGRESHDVSDALAEQLKIRDSFGWQLNKFCELSEEKAALTASLGAVGKELAELSPKLLEKMAELGLQNANVNGRLIYKQNSISVTMKPDTDRELLAEALIANGMTGCIQLGHQAMTALYKESEANGEHLPDSVMELMNIRDEIVLRSRKA